MFMPLTTKKNGTRTEADSFNLAAENLAGLATARQTNDHAGRESSHHAFQTNGV